MFTIEEINTAARENKTGADFPQFAAKLKALGVKRYDLYVMNGMAIYFGKDDEPVERAPAYESLIVNQQANAVELKTMLQRHQQGETDFQTFCRQAADAGVEKWIVDLVKLTVTYLDVSGGKLLVENIPIR